MVIAVGDIVLLRVEEVLPFHLYLSLSFISLLINIADLLPKDECAATTHTAMKSKIKQVHLSC